MEEGFSAYLASKALANMNTPEVSVNTLCCCQNHELLGILNLAKTLSQLT